MDQSQPARPVPPVARLPPRKKRLPRASRVCERCREKKYRCDAAYPCAHCKKSKVDCNYLETQRQRQRNQATSYIVDLDNRVIDLSPQLQNLGTTAGPPSQHRQILPGSNSEPQATSNTALSPIPQDGSPGDDISLFNDIGGGRADSDDGASEFNQPNSAFTSQQPQTPVEPTRSEASYNVHNQSSLTSYTTGYREGISLRDHNYYFEHAHAFISGYFDNVHYAHPFIDKAYFMSRSHDLWLNRNPQPELSFVALYLSVLSFGALVRVWDERRLSGLTRFEWSRKLFAEAQGYLNHLQFSTDLETVQCLYLMAKICQNEHNTNVAYMYLGHAVRMCLSAGFNQEDTRFPPDHRSIRISKTWWSLFSLEIEMSLSVGRPDTLGMDKFHNRTLPERDDSESAVISWMVDFSQITRKISVQIYHSRLSPHEKLQRALQIDAEMDRWFALLPDRIKPDVRGQTFVRLREPKWARRQRLVLGIRYCSMKTLLFGPFLRNCIHRLGDTPPELRQPISKCLDSAKKTIEVIYNTYTAHTFFRSWWYNTTYVMFATATLLLPLSKLGMSSDITPPLLRSVEMGVEILEAMDESVVAARSAVMIKNYLIDLRASATQSEAGDTGDDSTNGTTSAEAETRPTQRGVEIPEWALGFVFPDYSFEGLTQLFGGLRGPPLGT